MVSVIFSSVDSSPPQSDDDGQAESLPLSLAQLALVDYFASLASTFSLAPSIGQIYGLLFAHPQSLTFDQVVKRLKISKASASNGLQVLRRLKAVTARRQIGDRRTYYQAEVSIRRLLQGFVRDGISPQLEASVKNLDAIAELLENENADNPAAADRHRHLDRRLSSLRTWHHKIQRLIPWIARLTSSSRNSKDFDD